MNGPGDYTGEMSRLDDNEIESLLAGRAPAGDADLERLARLIDGAKVATALPVDAAVEQRHIAAMIEAARDATPVATRTRRAPLWTKIAAATVAAVATTGGLAAADQLPQPAQDAVAKVAERVGVNFPHSQDDEDVAGAEDEPGGDEGDTTGSKRVNEDVQTVLEDDTLEGRDRGGAVSDAADQNRRDGDTPAADNRQNEKSEPDKPSPTPPGFGKDNHPTGPPTDRP